MSKCPVCGRTGLVGKEHEIVGDKAVTVYKCHGCDNSWRVADKSRDEAPPPAKHTKPASRPGSKPSRRSAAAKAPRIVILSLPRAESYQPQHETEVCISITNTKAPRALLSSAFRAVLRLDFTDIAAPTNMPGHLLFAPEHAEAILEFVDTWAHADRIVIHCVGGLSRSPAVGMGICDLRDWPLDRMEKDYPLWNTWVRSELVRIGRKRKAPRRPSNP